MAQVPNRDEIERRVARRVSRSLQGINRDFVKKFIANGYDINDPDLAGLYYQLNDEMKEIMQPVIERIRDAQARLLASQFELGGVDWSLVNQAAANWARSYSTILAGQIEQTTRDRVADSIRNSISDYFEQGLNLGEIRARLERDPDLAKLFTKDIKDKLGRVFGPHRAEMIARTEITRAAVEGERFVVDAWRDKGIVLVETWQTRNDEIVCPICGPRNGEPIDNPKARRGGYWTRRDGPPAHPRCRCFVTFTFPKRKRAPSKPVIPEIEIPSSNIPGTGFTPAKSRNEAIDRIGNFVNNDKWDDDGFIFGVGDRRKGVHLNNVDLDELNSILKGFGDVADRYGVNVRYIGRHVKNRNQNAAGAFIRDARDPFDAAITFDGKLLRYPDLVKDESRNAWLMQHQAQEQKILDLLNDPKQKYFMGRHEKDLNLLQRIKRWGVGDEINDDYLEAVARHETYHAVYFQKDLEKKFIDALKKHGASYGDHLAVSEYAGSQIAELFAEAATAIDLGYDIPDAIRKAILEVLEDAI